MSLRVRLLLTLGLTLTLLWGLAAAWLMRDLHQQVEHTLDQRLAQSARMVAGLVSQLPAEVWQQAENRQLSIPPIAGLACQVHSPSGKVVARTHADMPEVLEAREPGYSYREDEGVQWRVYTYQRGDLTITTADRVDERDILLRDVLRVAVVPFLVALLGSLAALWLGILRGLRPLSRLRESLAMRDPEAIAPVATNDLPAELRPLVDTLNNLLARIRQAMAREQRFTSDAAHELRTPLTAIKTHLQVARRQQGEAAQHAQAQAEKGVARLQGTLEQLLMLARLEGGFDTQWPAGCQSGAVVEDALDTLDAEAQRAFVIDRGVREISLAVPHELAVTALRNLLENARRFSPAPGSVGLALQQDAAGLAFVIRDQGPGVDELALTKLTGRFWQQGNGHGSGLGLAIVAAIAERFAGHLRFEHNRPQGLVARLWFPLGPRHWPGEPRVAPPDAPAESGNDNERPRAGGYSKA
ncbi:Signal transduction histidine kinase [Modicisalibacter muralis]|uniref:histidine kinase n=1 Tax=Modicisalibacter muralis TaxID=119000 RepID=A0A1G9IYZ0_9GAMM|nr:ATP-binding protein [Halomonas muralis]SDL30173.1 Signal transduction histidine kinase [Halomonas muralis]